MRVRAAGCDRVRGDAVAPHLGRLDERERRDPALGGRVGALADAAHQARARRRVHDAGVDRRRRPCCVHASTRGVAGHREVTLQVDADDRVPLFLARREQHAVAHEAGVVDEHVEAAERVDRGLHERCAPSQSAMSSVFATASPPSASISSTTSCAGPVLPPVPSRATPRSFTTTRALAGEAERVLAADAAPAPVTMTMRPSQIPVTGPYPTGGRWTATMRARPPAVGAGRVRRSPTAPGGRRSSPARSRSRVVRGGAPAARSRRLRRRPRARVRDRG